MPEKKIIDGVQTSVFGVSFNDQGQMLMLLLSENKLPFRKDAWEMPKGAMHFGESEEEAVKREILEETGLEEIEIIEKIPKIYWDAKPTKDGELKIRSVVFVCKYIGGEIKLSHEHTEHRWMPFEEVREKIWLRKGKRMIDDAHEIFTSQVS